MCSNLSQYYINILDLSVLIFSISTTDLKIINSDLERYFHKKYFHQKIEKEKTVSWNFIISAGRCFLQIIQSKLDFTANGIS